MHSPVAAANPRLFEALIHAQKNGTLHIFPSFNKKTFGILTFGKYEKLQICLLNISWQQRKYSL